MVFRLFSFFKKYKNLHFGHLDLAFRFISEAYKPKDKVNGKKNKRFHFAAKFQH